MEGQILYELHVLVHQVNVILEITKQLFKGKGGGEVRESPQGGKVELGHGKRYKGTLDEILCVNHLKVMWDWLPPLQHSFHIVSSSIYIFNYVGKLLLVPLSFVLKDFKRVFRLLYSNKLLKPLTKHFVIISTSLFSMS